MKRLNLFLILVALRSFFDGSYASSQVPPAGFEAIFNGKDLAGWYAIETYNPREVAALSSAEREAREQAARASTGKFWRVENGEIVNDGQGPFLTIESEYRDFELLIEYKTVAKAEFAKLDPRQYHGSAYGMVAAHRGFLRPTGEWNFQRVTVNGSTIVVELNGTTILDCDLANLNEFLEDKPHPGKDRTTGYFGLAGHHDPVEFRNLKIKRLETTD